MGWDRVATDASGNIVGDRLIITLNEYLNDPVGSLGFIDNDEQTVTFIARWYKPFTWAAAPGRKTSTSASRARTTPCRSSSPWAPARS